MDLIEVDGILRPHLNSLGRLIHPSKKGVVNFWRWFGNSQCVDEMGRPLVLFHGTDEVFDAFVAAQSGMFGGGCYFGDMATAHEYGGDGQSILPVYLRVANPFDTMADYDVTADVFDLESAAGPLMSELFGASASMIAHCAREGDGDLDEGVEDELRKRGHDGLRIEWGETQWWVAYRPEQIKSALGNSGRFDPASANLTDHTPAPQAAVKRRRECVMAL